MTFNIDYIRSQFPILSREINGHPVAYLDNAASAQKPQAVLDALSHQMSHSFANVHRGLHTMANETTEAYDCLLYTSPSPRDATLSRMPSSA